MVCWSAEPSVVLRQAVQAMEAGNFVAAASYFEQALQYDPKNVSIVSSLGFCLAGAGRFGDAAGHFRTLTTLEPGVGAHRYNLGLALLRAGEFPAAESAFRETLGVAPEYPRAQVQLGNTLLAQAREGETGKMKQAAEAYTRALAQNGNDPELRFNLAFTLARTGDEAGSLEQYWEVIRLAPGFPRAYFFLGITLFQLGRWEEAAPPLREAMARGETDFHVHYYLGSALLKLEDQEGARRHLNSAVQLDPLHPGVHFQLAALHRATGDKTQAMQELRAFRDLTARQEAEWRANALEQAARRALQQGDLAEGISALEQAFEGRPSVSAARNLALAYLQEGNLVGARSLLEKSLELASEDGPTHNYLGLLEAREGNLVLAEKHFQQAAGFDAGLVDALYNAGIVASKSGHPDRAVAHLREAVRRSNTPRIREALAMALADAGQMEEAQQQFDAAQKQGIALGDP
ncbi:MAG: tetratricopeptide repeat protein [Acidobacteria bacterium]|nr:tetratricopeptide repeat protein [Acidobacteriota bacterium]